jgi:hypothetical protein
MPRMGALEREETRSLILVCRARGYNHKQILSVVNDNLKKYNNTVVIIYYYLSQVANTEPKTNAYAVVM